VAVVGDLLLGKFLLQSGQIGEEALRDCLEQLRRSTDSGQVYSLGELLIHRGLIPAAETARVEQQLRALDFRCGACRAAWSFDQLRHSPAVHCLACGSPLTIRQGEVDFSDRLFTGRGAAQSSSARSKPQRFDTRRDKPTSRRGSASEVQSSGNRMLTTASSLIRKEGGRQWLEDFEILAELGRGGMGVVYKARHPTDGVVALKVLLAGSLASKSQVERFKREAEICARLRHPAIVPIYETGDLDGHPYLTMEYVEGEPLSSYIQKRKLGVREAVLIARDAARGLHYAHSRQVVHRDIKPENIIVDSQLRPRITDFGLARELDDQERLTRTGALLGTPYYMSPEQASGSKEVGPASDIYSLGVVLFECLTFELPLQSESQVELLDMITRAPAPAPSFFEPTIDPDIDTITLKTLAKRPERRYLDASALADDLDAYLEGEPILARPPTKFSLALEWVEQRRSGAVVLGGILAVLALVIGGVLFTMITRARAEEAAERRRVARLEEQQLKDAKLKRQAAEKRKQDIASSFDTAEEWVRKSRKCADSKEALENRREAVEELNRLLKTAPKHVRGLVLRGEMRLRLREPKAAEKDLRAAGEDPKALIYRAKLKIRASSNPNVPTEAIELMERAAAVSLKGAPEVDDFWPKLAAAVLIQLRGGKAEDALLALEPLLAEYPFEIDLLLAKGYLLTKMGRFAESKRTYARIISIDNNSETALANLAKMALESGSPERAREFAEHLLSLNPRSPSAALVFFNLNYLKDAPRAIRFANVYLEAHPDDGKVRRVLAKLLIREKRLLEAAEQLRTQLGLDKKDGEAYELLVQALVGLKRLDAAEKRLNEGLTAITDREKNAALFGTLINFLLTHERTKTAVTRCRTRLTLHPLEISTRLLLSRALFENGDKASALASLAALARDEPSNRAALRQLTHLQRGTGLRAECEKSIKQMLDNAPKKAESWALAAELHCGFYDFDLAKKEIEKAIAIDSKPAYQVILGLILMRTGDYTKAQVHYQGVYESSGTPRKLRALAAAGLAELKGVSGNLDGAERTAREAMRLDRDCVEAYVLLVKVYSKKKDIKSCKRVVGAAIQSGATNGSLFEVAALFELATGKDNLAFQLLQESISLEPWAMHRYPKIVQIMLKNGKRKAAVDAVETGLKIDPDYKPLLELKARLSP